MKMKKIGFLVLTIIGFTLVFSGCKKDDSSPSGDFPGVPIGDIVPIEEREATLIKCGLIPRPFGSETNMFAEQTPFNTPMALPRGSLSRTSASFKSTDSISENFWTYAEAKVTISGCGEEETQDVFEDQGIDPSTIQISFGTDYILYTKRNGTIDEAGGWSWSGSSKDGIILDKYPSIEFTFTALNKNEVVYASKQTGAYDDCNSVTAITYERVVAQ